MRHHPFFSILTSLSSLFLLRGLSSCEPEPELHLHDGIEVALEMPIVTATIDQLWQYDLSYIDGKPHTYNWKSEWVYGWDQIDEHDYGPIGYKTPDQYQVRRYYQGSDWNLPHQRVRTDVCLGQVFRANYNFGYYDMLLWNEPQPIDGIESNHFDETSLDSVVCYTNSTIGSSRNPAAAELKGYFAPDELFSSYKRGVFISRDASDYDLYDEENDVFYKLVDFEMQPRTYIFLTQVIIHNNRDRTTNTGGEAGLSGMARTATLNSGQSGSDPIAVTYTTRMKRNVRLASGEVVDVIGGRVVSFGICGIRPNELSSPLQVPGYVQAISSGRYGQRAGVSAQSQGSYRHHYMDINFVFHNGMDSTLVFDVTDKVMERFRGGVITFEVDMDTIPIPTRGGGSGFSASVGDYEDGGTFEIPL